MTATLIATAPATRMAIVVGTSEVTFTPYVIRKVGEVRTVVIDGVTQEVIYNERRNLTYFVLEIDGTPTTGRIAAELVEGGEYGSCKKSARVAPPVGKKALAAAPTPNSGAEVEAPTDQPTKKVRKPKA